MISWTTLFGFLKTVNRPINDSKVSRYDAAPDLGPLGQDDVRLAGHEDELQAPGWPRAHHLEHLLLREIQPHLQSARASDEALQQPGEWHS